jgi:hypothetical protein
LGEGGGLANTKFIDLFGRFGDSHFEAVCDSLAAGLSVVEKDSTKFEVWTVEVVGKGRIV